MKLGSRSLPPSSIPSRLSGRSRVHDTFIGGQHLPALLLGTLYPSSTNCNTVPRRRGLLSNKRTSSTTNVTDHFAFCSVCLDIDFHPHPIRILHPPKTGIPHPLLFPLHQSVPLRYERYFALLFLDHFHLICGYHHEHIDKSSTVIIVIPATAMHDGNLKSGYLGRPNLRPRLHNHEGS